MTSSGPSLFSLSAPYDIRFGSCCVGTKRLCELWNSFPFHDVALNEDDDEGKERERRREWILHWVCEKHESRKLYLDSKSLCSSPRHAKNESWMFIMEKCSSPKLGNVKIMFRLVTTCSSPSYIISQSRASRGDQVQTSNYFNLP